jgi:beta-glucosidase
MIQYPPAFKWGVGTSAYQIEGGRTDGKGDSIWDRFSDEGRLTDPGDVTCDHYHRWQEDIELMATHGIRSYRFSIAWSRVLPAGGGATNPSGIEFYRRLVDGLVEAGIEPVATLYHWDLPARLQDDGGWTARATVDAFTDYAALMVETLGDRVRTWITHNEPWVASMLGHLEGVFAPGLTGWDNALPAAHHILLSHGTAAQAIRERQPDASVGIALDCRPCLPSSTTPEDEDAARHFDGFRNRWFFDPVFDKGYPADIVEEYRRRGRLPDGPLPFVYDGDMATIAAPIDFLGLNYYTSIRVAAEAEESEDTGVPPSSAPPAGYTEMGWEITPEALTTFLQRIDDEYGPTAIVITENGASYSDGPDAHGVVTDHRRIDYLQQHIEATEAAMRSGVPVTGYFVWSLLDNLEWVAGFSQRFGLVWVDHATGRRIPKESLRWYRDVITAKITG